MRTLFLLALTACTATPGEGRRGWLVDRLVEDNRVWSGRDPALLATKYARMAADPYDFMRGSFTVHIADLSRAGTGRIPTELLGDARESSVLLVGDPHPENVGCFASEDTRILDFNDLDGTSHGPWLLDLRRAALGLRTLADHPRCDAACAARAVEALASGYLAGAADEELTSPPGRAVDDLFSESIEEGSERKRYHELTIESSGGTVFLRDDGLDELGKGHLDPTLEEARQIQVLFGALHARIGPIRLLDAIRRMGRGVASLPARRYLLLYDRGDEGPDDDRMVEVREIVDTVALPGLVQPVEGLLDDVVARVEQGVRYLWSRPDLDPVHLGLSDGGTSFRTATFDSIQQGFDHERIHRKMDEGEMSGLDLLRLGERIGHRLGQAHRGAPAADGQLPTWLDPSPVLIDELVTMSEEDHRTLLDDHAHFRDALDLHGPLLGADDVLETR